MYPNFENLTTHITSLLAAFKVETLHNKSDECRTKAGGLVLFRPPTESKHEIIGKLTEFIFQGGREGIKIGRNKSDECQTKED